MQVHTFVDFHTFMCKESASCCFAAPDVHSTRFCGTFLSEVTGSDQSNFVHTSLISLTLSLLIDPAFEENTGTIWYNISLCAFSITSVCVSIGNFILNRDTSLQYLGQI